MKAIRYEDAQKHADQESPKGPEVGEDLADVVAACTDPVKICSCYKGEGSDVCDDGRQHQTVDGEA